MNIITKIIQTLSLIFVIFTSCVSSSWSADFQVLLPATPQETTMVMVIGELRPNDHKKFISSTLDIDNAMVVFSSNGGSLLAGLEIGKAIRLKNFSTYVPSNYMCASACAIAWVGGSQRFMSRSAMIGFHAAYVNKQNGPTETGMGNALVGAYLNSLGLPNRAVAYMTSAAPESMQWLQYEDAQKLGLNVSIFDVPSNGVGEVKSRPSHLETERKEYKINVPTQGSELPQKKVTDKVARPTSERKVKNKEKKAIDTLFICRPFDTQLLADMDVVLNEKIVLEMKRGVKYKVSQAPKEMIVGLRYKQLIGSTENQIQLNQDEARGNFYLAFFYHPLLTKEFRAEVLGSFSFWRFVKVGQAEFKANCDATNEIDIVFE